MVTLNYIAGFFDGEGCITHRRPKAGGRAYRKVSMSQKDPEVLEAIQTYLGYGRLRQRKYPGSGGVWVLHIDNRHNIRDFLTRISPHLIVKREKAMEVLDDYV